MVEVGIYEEDLIGVSKSIEPKLGSIVVARINNEVTVKTLSEFSKNKITLKPENKNHKDINVDPSVDEFEIEGSCVALIRDHI